MLQHLSIKNYALIDHLELDFHQGFSVITGETGAGKSIMLSALSLILGKRADVKSLKQQDSKCIVEGSFFLNSNQFKTFFNENDLDFEEQSFLRREITPSGKSRAFVNDTPVNLEVLALLGERLIDIHSQHQNLLLSNISFQLQLLDSFADNYKQQESYTKAFNNYKLLSSQLEELHKTAQTESGDSDYLQFLFEELQNANIKNGEQEEIEEELSIVENAAEIQSALAHSTELLDGEQKGIIDKLKEVINQLTGLTRFNTSFGNLASRVESSLIELDDISAELKSEIQKVDFEPQQATDLDERLSLLIALQRKHQVKDLEELIEKRDSLDQRIQNLSGLEDRIREVENKLNEVKENLKVKASNLHNSRLKVIPDLEFNLKKILSSLNMTDASFTIDLQEVEDFTERGNGKVNFLFNANKGQKPNKLSKTASGGELSRVMLALKAIMAQTKNLPAIIFDEIDTGVSGETAGKIGDILKQMGNNMQVIAISHLPQIASKGSGHYKVEKVTDKQITKTRIFELAPEERINELARLLSGEKISEAALKNARELLDAV